MVQKSLNESGLDPAAKAQMLSAINRLDRVSLAFGQVRRNYPRLAEDI